MLKFLNDPKLITTVGVPAIIALYLVYYLTTVVTEAHTAQSYKLNGLGNYLWAICHEIAANESGRNRCDEIRAGREPRR